MAINPNVMDTIMKSPLVRIAIFASLILSGCATFKHTYHDVSPSTTIRTDKSVAIASLDHREYVRSGRSRPDFVGMLRGGYGNTFDVHTESGRPLSDEFTAAMRGALERNGIQVIVLTTKPTQDSGAVMSSLATTRSDRKLLLTIREWMSDSMINTELGYDLQLTVADGNGKTLATSPHKELRSLGGNLVNAVGHAQSAVNKAFREAVESLLNSPDVAAALK
jgi:hypothetical protein